MVDLRKPKKKTAKKQPGRRVHPEIIEIPPGSLLWAFFMDRPEALQATQQSEDRSQRRLPETIPDMEELRATIDFVIRQLVGTGSLTVVQGAIIRLAIDLFGSGKTFSIPEIAQIFGTTEDDVKQQLTGGKEMLKDNLYLALRKDAGKKQ